MKLTHVLSLLTVSFLLVACPQDDPEPTPDVEGTTTAPVSDVAEATTSADTTGSATDGGTTGDDTTGDDTTGGETTGDATTGDDTTGDATIGDDTTGGDTAGGDTAGGDTTTDGGGDTGDVEEPTEDAGPVEEDTGPVEMGLVSKTVTFETTDGKSIWALFHVDKSSKEGAPGVVLVHQYQQTKTQWNDVVEDLTSKGWRVLAIDRPPRPR